jgi:hypothetical protein
VSLAQADRWHLRIDARTVFANITLEDDVDIPAR